MEQHDIDDFVWEGLAEEVELTWETFNQLLGFTFLFQNMITQREQRIIDQYVSSRYGNEEQWNRVCYCRVDPQTSQKCNSLQCICFGWGEECGPFCGDGCCNQRFRNNQFKSKFNVVHRHGRGFGVVVQERVNKFDFLMEFLGRVYLDDENPWRYFPTYVCDLLTFGEQALVIEASGMGNISRFIAHSHRPNCSLYRVRSGNTMHVVVIALEPILPGSELFIDYGEQFVDLNLNPCLCYEDNCTHLEEALVHRTYSRRRMFINSELEEGQRQLVGAPEDEAEASSMQRRAVIGERSPGQVQRARSAGDGQRPGHSRDLVPEMYRSQEMETDGASTSTKRKRSDPTTPPEQKQQQKKQRQKSSSEESSPPEGQVDPKVLRQMKIEIGSARAATPTQVSTTPPASVPNAPKKPPPSIRIQLDLSRPVTVELINWERTREELLPLIQQMRFARLMIPRCQIPIPNTARQPVPPESRRLALAQQTINPQPRPLHPRVLPPPPAAVIPPMLELSPPHDPASPVNFSVPPTLSPRAPPRQVRELRSRQVDLIPLPCGLQAAIGARNVEAPEAPQPRRGPGRPKTRKIDESGPKEKKRPGRPKTNPDVHQCEYCGAIFGYKHVLKSHLNLHTKEFSYPCPHCPESFSGNAALQYHIGSWHTPDSERTQYRCPCCPAKFYNSKDCRKHQGRPTNNCKTDQDPIVIRPRPDRRRRRPEPEEELEEREEIDSDD